MSSVVAMALFGAGCPLYASSVAIWILDENEEFLAKQVPKIEQLEAKIERLIELYKEEE